MPEKGDAYSGYIAAELDREYARRDAVNSRAATVLTSATGLVTLVVGAAAVLKGQGKTIDGVAEFFLVIAVLALLGAAVCGVVAGYPFRYTVTNEADIGQILGPQWPDDDVTAKNKIGTFNKKALFTLRKGTTTKTSWLLGAFVLQALSIAALGAALIAVVR